MNIVFKMWILKKIVSEGRESFPAHQMREHLSGSTGYEISSSIVEISLGKGQ